ncbi:30S ribosomal protein S13 [Candidatus Peregrinibacteria bacterium]|nr:30S ribosomal protein S13 [Candidatus Peregrinibacteria bacterium]
MARVAGVNLPKEKRIEAALTAIHGVGRSLSARIIKEANLDKDTKVKDLTENEVGTIRSIIEKISTEGDLKRKTAMDIKRLQEIGSYRGFRHKKGLPVRGQRTRYNARTRKGRKKTVANKKIATK